MILRTIGIRDFNGQSPPVDRYKEALLFGKTMALGIIIVLGLHHILE